MAARNFFMPLRRFFGFGYYSLMAYLIAFESLMLRTVPKVGLAQQGTFKETFGTFCVRGVNQKSPRVCEGFLIGFIGSLSFEFPEFDAGVIVAVCLEEQFVVEDDQIRRSVVARRVYIADEFWGGAVELP